MLVKFYLISFDKGLRKKGYNLFFVGVFILLLNVIPGIWERTGMLIAGLGTLTILSGLLMIHLAEYKKEKAGSLNINETTIIITEKDKSEIKLERNDFHFEIKNPGFEGKSNYIPFLTIGSLTTHSGINEIRIYNQHREFNFEILIENKQRLNLFLELINKEIQKYNGTIKTL